eukprot:TCALIF_02974-PA protein Name:"Protein of unknown function" AED:0.13 eAED:0.13 QI:355/0.75/0.8/0.8/1/1/5/0/230
MNPLLIVRLVKLVHLENSAKNGTTPEPAEDQETRDETKSEIQHGIQKCDQGMEMIHENSGLLPNSVQNGTLHWPNQILKNVTKPYTLEEHTDGIFDQAHSPKWISILGFVIAILIIIFLVIGLILKEMGAVSFQRHHSQSYRPTVLRSECHQLEELAQVGYTAQMCSLRHPAVAVIHSIVPQVCAYSKKITSNSSLPSQDHLFQKCSVVEFFVPSKSTRRPSKAGDISFG